MHTTASKILKAILTPLAASVLLLSGCMSMDPESYTPRRDQQRWLNADEAADIIVKCLNEADMATQKIFAVRKYASYLRLCYGHVSQRGTDEDAGIRALNYCKYLHFQAKGSRQLWNEVVSLAKTRYNDNDNDKLQGLEIPESYDR